MTAVPDQRPLLWTLTAGCAQLGISKPRAYRLARAGKLELLSDGGRTYIADRELRRYVESLQPVTAPPPVAPLDQADDNEPSAPERTARPARPRQPARQPRRSA